MKRIKTHAEQKQNSPGTLVQERTDFIVHAMEALELKEKTRWEIAFAIAEISPELEEMLSLVEKAKLGEPFTRDDLVSLQGMAYHWPQHLGDLKRYLLRAFDELDPD